MQQGADPITRAFESLAALPVLEGGFLRQLLFQAIDDPVLATDLALSEHLLLVPQVLRALALDPQVVRQIHTLPGMEEWIEDAISSIAAVAADSTDVSRETLTRLSLVALRDVSSLANFLENRPVSQFIDH